MIMARAVLRAKGQVTLPAEIRKALHIDEGDDIGFEVTDDGVRMRGMKSIRADQAWFWTPEWQAGERRVDEEMAAGRGKISSSTEEFLESLD